MDTFLPHASVALPVTGNPAVCTHFSTCNPNPIAGARARACVRSCVCVCVRVLVGACQETPWAVHKLQPWTGQSGTSSRLHPHPYTHTSPKKTPPFRSVIGRHLRAFFVPVCYMCVLGAPQRVFGYACTLVTRTCCDEQQCTDTVALASLYRCGNTTVSCLTSLATQRAVGLAPSPSGSMRPKFYSLHI